MLNLNFYVYSCEKKICLTQKFRLEKLIYNTYTACYQLFLSKFQHRKYLGICINYKCDSIVKCFRHSIYMSTNYISRNMEIYTTRCVLVCINLYQDNLNTNEKDMKYKQWIFSILEIWQIKISWFEKKNTNEQIM